MPIDEDFVNQVANQQQVSVIAKSHTMNVELHSRIELHSDVELQNDIKAHSDFEISLHERNV